MMISRETINDITQLIAEEYSPERIILIGSYTSGKATSESDLDLLVISDREGHLPRRKRGIDLLNKLRKYHFPKDVLFYTQAEIDKWKNVDAAFITEATKYGVVLYG